MSAETGTFNKFSSQVILQLRYLCVVKIINNHKINVHIKLVTLQSQLHDKQM